MTPDEKLWHEDAARYGYKLPAPAPRLLRLPVIRLLRTLILALRVERHYAVASLWGLRNPYDDWVLYAVRRGWC